MSHVQEESTWAKSPSSDTGTWGDHPDLACHLLEVIFAGKWDPDLAEKLC